MKRSFNLFILLFFFTAITYGQGIQNLRIGARGGLNVATLSGTGNDGDVGPLLRYYVGGYVAADIIEKLGVQAELTVSAQGAREANDVVDAVTNINFTYLNLPILARYEIMEQLSVFAGLQFGLLLSANGVIKENGIKAVIEAKDVTTSTDIAFILGGSYEVIEGLHAELRLAPGFVNTNNNPNATFFNRVLQLGVAYDIFKP